MAKAAIAALEKVPGDRIVTPSSSCAITMTDDYVRLFAEDDVWRARARRVGERIQAFTKIAHELACNSAVKGRKLDIRATYHDACQSENVLGLHDQPRALLRDVAGVELIELTDSFVCCGFGGTFSFEYPEVANFVLEKKLENIKKTGADVVITDNPGCLTHLKGGLDARGRTTKVRHLAEILWQSLSPAD
ncbi:MAG: (Fe-S)-binding protein [Chloroflexi bacterium]|nr:MAG: (Fe-S)-binding protein [Chloroflexota bacterium]